MKCQGEVCVVGNWIIEKTGYKIWEDWANDGLNLEGNMYSNTNFINKLKYKVHFMKPYIMFSYFKKLS